MQFQGDTILDSTFPSNRISRVVPEHLFFNKSLLQFIPFGKHFIEGIPMEEKEYGSTKIIQLSHLAIEQAADGIFWLDSEGRIHRVNDAACRLLGYSREELLTMTVPDVDPEYSVEAYKESYWRKVRKLGTINFESCHRRKDGSTYPVEISSCYVQFEGTGYSCAFFRDITERKRVETALRESENKLSAIINHHFQLTGLLDSDGRLIMANETALNLIGVEEEEEVLGKYFWDTPWWNHSRRLQKKLKKAILKAATGEFVRFEATLRRISIIDGPIFKQYDGSKMGYRANIVFGNSDGADFSYQLHLRVIKKDILHPVYLP